MPTGAPPVSARGTDAGAHGVLLVASGLAAGALLLRLWPGPWPVDDAYITFRYARNLLEGAGLVYNAGEPVLGTSSPGFAFLLALGGALTGLDPPRVALGCSAVADALTVLMLPPLARSLGLPGLTGVIAAGTWALYPLGARYAVGGMETSVAAALGVATLLLWLSGRAVPAMVPAAAAILVRPDAAVFAVAVLAGQGAAIRGIPWRPLAAAIALLLPWVAFATARYGTPVPHSVTAKSHAVYLAAPWDNLVQVLNVLAGLVAGGPTDLAAEGIAVHRPPAAAAGYMLVGVLVLTAFAAGALDAIRRRSESAVAFAVPSIVCATYAGLGLGRTLMAEWYLVPVAPLLFLGVVAGLVRAGRRLPRSPALAIVAGLALVLAQAAGWEWTRVADGRAPLPRIVDVEREMLYRDVALALRPRLRADQVVAAPEIGALGYHCHCRILDTAGLVSPRALAYYPVARELHVVNQAVPPGLIRDTRPDFVVSLDVFIARSLLAAPWFAEQYRPALEMPAGAFGSTRLLVLERRPGA
jgi:hypothetical protein